MRLALGEYMNHFAWSQAQFAREAECSTTVISRALNGEVISRRNAEKIVAAIDRKLKAQGVKDRITVESINGLRISDYRRKKRPGQEE